MRKTQQILIVGTNGTGKSTVVGRLIDKKLEAGGRALIVSNHQNEWTDTEQIDLSDKKEIRNFTGTRRTHLLPKQLPLLLNIHNCIIVFDDARNFISAKTDDALNNLQISRRQKMIDIVVVAHSFSQMPISFFTFATHYILFKTVVSAKNRKNYVADIDKVLDVEQRVNSRAVTEPHYFEIITL